MTACPKRELHGSCKSKHAARYRKKARVQWGIAESSAIWSNCSVVLNNVKHIFSIIASSDCGVTDNLGKLGSSSQFPPQSHYWSIASAAVYQSVCSFITLYRRLKKIVWSFLSGGLCVCVCWGCVLAFGYIRCYRRNLYCWVWNSYRRGKIRSSSVVYWTLKKHL